MLPEYKVLMLDASGSAVAGKLLARALRCNVGSRSYSLLNKDTVSWC